MQFKYIRDKKEELVTKEQWCWEAYYSDGTILKQFDGDGFFHQFGEIDQSRLVVFKMVNDIYTHTLLFEEGMKLIHYYDNYLLNDGQLKIKVYCFGFEKGKEKRVFNILPNNELLITDGKERVRVS